MRIKTIILGAAAAAFAAAPIVAQAAGRTAAPIGGENALGYPESATQLIVLAVIAAAIVGGIALFDEDEPASP
ncbi:MAG TPA: hypothetical protein VFS87_11200 [Qipengyuania sp.]|nr:hypothetical protein [Qipengyuania sp.]